MTREVHPLTPRDMALLVTWLDQEGHVTAAELARRLGRPYFTIAKAVQRLRQRGGWYTVLAWGTCSECGRDLPMARDHSPRTAHLHCARKRTLRHQRDSRKRRPGQSTPYVRAWRRHHPDQDAAHRERHRARVRALWPDLPEEEREAALAKVHAADQRDYELTAELAENSGAGWDPDDDRYIVEHWHDPARDLGLALGRSVWSVRNRRVALRKLHPELGRARPPRDRWLQ